MINKKTVTFVLAVLLFLFFLVSLLIRYSINSYRRSIISPPSTITALLSSERRGVLNEEGNDVLYQFPITILTEPVLNNGIYTAKVSPFNSVQEDFDLVFGPDTAKIPFGTCSFDEKGEINSQVIWSLTDYKTVATSLRIGDKIVVRLMYPTQPNSDQKQYAEQLKKKIVNLEKQIPIGSLVPNMLCSSSTKM